jgi:hypothetical protein
MEDPRTEHWLTTEGVSYVYEPAVPVGLVDVEASKRNQARVNAPLIEDLVERYTMALIDGAEFPALLAYRRDDGRLVLLDGNQRMAAALDAEREAVDAYVVSGLDEMRRTALCWTANTLNGDPGTPLDRMLLAKAFHLRYPLIPRSEVARRFRIQVKKLERELRTDEVGAKLMEFGLDPEAFNDTSKERLHAFIASDVQFREASKFIQEANLKGGLLQEFWVDARRARSDAEMLQIIERWRERPDIQELMRQKRFNRPHIPKSKIQQALDKLDSLIRHFERYSDLQSLEVAGRDEVLLVAARYKHLGPIIQGLLRDVNRAQAA